MNKPINPVTIRAIEISDMRINPQAQRELNQAHVDYLLANFDAEALGIPLVSEHKEGGVTYYNVVEGHHRVTMLKQKFGADTLVNCQVRTGLTTPKEAGLFRDTNKRLNVAAIADYRAAVTQGSPAECHVERILRKLDMVITADKIEGGIRAVGTVMRVYGRSGGPTLERTLRIIRDAYGTPGLEAPIIDGIGYFVDRYGEEVKDHEVIEKLSRVHGGSSGLLGAATKLRLSTGNAKAHCLAAAAVTVVNRGRPKKLQSWWK